MKTLNDFFEMKKNNEKIAMCTAYDYTSALLSEESGLDMLLVGDSLGMVVQGKDSTIEVTIDEMIYHGKMVRRGAPNTFVVMDMPFGTYHSSKETAIENIIKVYQHTGANCIKVEGVQAIELIPYLNEVGIPVCAHLGLNPQSVGMTGFKLQATDVESANKLIESAKYAESNGASLLVLEAVPSDVAKVVSESISIPVIGIGAGVHTDGQVLVYHDLLQYGTESLPKFVKTYANLNDICINALTHYVQDVKSMTFPDDKTTYKKQVFEDESH